MTEVSKLTLHSSETVKSRNKSAKLGARQEPRRRQCEYRNQDFLQGDRPRPDVSVKWMRYLPRTLSSQRHSCVVIQHQVFAYFSPIMSRRILCRSKGWQISLSVLSAEFSQKPCSTWLEDCMMHDESHSYCKA